MKRLDRDARVLVAWSEGLVGSAVVRALEAAGFTDIVGALSAEVDLRDVAATRDFLDRVRPDVAVDAAARVGGIAANDVRFDESYLRPTEVDALIGDASKAHRELGWKAQTMPEQLAHLMVDAEAASLG